MEKQTFTDAINECSVLSDELKAVILRMSETLTPGQMDQIAQVCLQEQNGFTEDMKALVHTLRSDTEAMEHKEELLSLPDIH